MNKQGCVITEHECIQDKKINTIAESIDGLKEEVKLMREQLNSSMSTVQEITDVKTFLRIGRNAGVSFVAFLLGCGAVIGVVYSVKEWIKK